ncbi:sodium:solute symporter family protein [Komagataeibacter rhaeticus]|uniref:sodium:solute symporter family protein n=1 Tax=Komagataeibacter rhaeticus TaxID=215221 RepID=UPI0039E951D0
MWVSFAIVAIFCLSLIVVLQKTYIPDRSFDDYAVGGRSFGSFFQGMAFLNTWWPGGLILSLTGMAATQGTLAFFMPVYSLLTVLLMMLIGRRVWYWGMKHDLRTQSDMLRLRYGSRGLSVIMSVVTVVSVIPWLVLGLKGLGTLFSALTYGYLSTAQSVLSAVVIILLRQIWTVRMGMRGLVISDLYQGCVAYIGGTLLIIGAIIWLLIHGGFTFEHIRAHAAPVQGRPLYFASLVVAGTLGGWCWPPIFVRLYTADNAHSVMKAGVIGAPVSLVFSLLLIFMGYLAGRMPSFAHSGDMIWYDVFKNMQGNVLLGFAATVILAASMGNVDGNIQSIGTQISNDIIGVYQDLNYKKSIIYAKIAMGLVTLFAAFLACFDIQHLSDLAILAYQAILQVSVVIYGGLWWRRGNATGAIMGMGAGFVTAVLLELYGQGILNQMGGVTSGIVALLVNITIYILCGLFLPQDRAECARITGLFEQTISRQPSRYRASAYGLMVCNVVIALVPVNNISFVANDIYISNFYYFFLCLSVMVNIFLFYVSEK